MKENTFAQTFLDLFDDSVEKSNELTASEKETISATFPDQEQLSDSLPMLLEKVEGFNNNIETANTNIKKWQETKKMWQTRKDQLLEILGKAMERLHIPGKSLKADGIKLSSRSGSVVEFDEDWMLQQYQQLADELQSRLPTYVKVKLAIDKTKLNAHLAQDDSLLINHPDKIHTKPTSSTTIK
ncbi:MAG: hypothetical protein IJ584_07880 [Bacteroidales bacterium]|nr:hypothetical protein [Bacteroidales bacterium]